MPATRQGFERAWIDQFENAPIGGGLAKCNPIAYWTFEDTFDYIAKYKVPHHPVHAQGYPSHGDAKDTIPVPSMDERAKPEGKGEGVTKFVDWKFEGDKVPPPTTTTTTRAALTLTRTRTRTRTLTLTLALTLTLTLPSPSPSPSQSEWCGYARERLGRFVGLINKDGSTKTECGIHVEGAEKTFDRDLWDASKTVKTLAFG